MELACRISSFSVPELTSGVDIKLNRRDSLRLAAGHLAWLPVAQMAISPRLSTARLGVAALPVRRPRPHKTKDICMPWSTPFEDPIVLPDGRQLLTLKDAADYITKLPKKESDLPEWQTAIEVLLLFSRGGPTMMARIGVMKALNRHVERVFNPDRDTLGQAQAEERRMRSIEIPL